MTRSIRMAGLATFAAALSGCVQTSDLYAVRQWAPPRMSQPDDRPRINPTQLEAKASFVQFVKDECGEDKITDAEADAHGFKPETWAGDGGHRKVAVCVQRIASYAADQCIMITRRQNVVAADANLALGAVTLGSGLAAVGYAVKGSADDRTSAASLAGAAAASNTSRAFLPANASVKVTDLLGAALTYAEYAGLTDDDWRGALTYQAQDDHGRRTPARAAPERPDAPGDVQMIKLARVHDAVFAGCSANAYGLVPARKPFK